MLIALLYIQTDQMFLYYSRLHLFLQVDSTIHHRTAMLEVHHLYPHC